MAAIDIKALFANSSPQPKPTAPVAEVAETRPAISIQFREMAIAQWQGAMYDEARRLIQQPLYREQDSLMLQLATVANNAPRTSALIWPPGVGENELEGALAIVAQKALAANGVAKPAAAIVIPWESHESALQANEAYLARTPVIDRLCYSSSVSMITGGKHAGKSTLARWMAICVAKGLTFLKRPVVQGPVVYIASEDETMAARQELLRLGWEPDDPIKFLSAGNTGVSDRVKLLEAIARDIKAHGVLLVIFDMLFDFVDISNEMSYAETQRALGRIQDVASVTKAHVVTTHHAPKHSQSSEAGVTALGSQGLAAKVSPIILVRRFGPGVHSVVSTEVRDPRGEAIIESRLLRHEDGSVTLGGVWKTYMLAEAYSERVLEFIDAEEGGEVTAGDLAAGLDIAYPVARACVSSLYKNGALDRFGEGKKGKPFRYTRKRDLVQTAGDVRERKAKVGTSEDIDEFFKTYQSK